MARAFRKWRGRTGITLGACCDIGQQRAVNQDAYCALVGPDAPQGIDAVVAVADGMGGHRAGDVASELAIRRFSERLRKRDLLADMGESVRQQVRGVNQDVFRASSRPGLEGMGTTLTTVVLAGRQLYIAHVGDCRAYLWRRGTLARLTKDHSWVAEQIAAGLLEPGEADAHPARNLLTRAIGVGLTVEVDASTLAIEKGDILLVCSDGVHSVLDDGEIAAVLQKRPPDEASKTLAALANSRGGKDNITAVVLRIDNIGADDSQPPAVRAAAGRTRWAEIIGAVKRALGAKA